MTPLLLGFLGLPAVLILIFLRVPIGIAMLTIGVFGSWAVTGSFNPVSAQFKNLTYSTYAS